MPAISEPIARPDVAGATCELHQAVLGAGHRIDPGRLPLPVRPAAAAPAAG